VKFPLGPPSNDIKGKASQLVVSFQYCRMVSIPIASRCLPLEMLSESETPKVQRLRKLKFCPMDSPGPGPPPMSKSSIEQGKLGVWS